MTRLFVTVWPTDDVRRHLRQLRRDDWSDVRWTPEQNWHVTLRFLGEAEIDACVEALSGVTFPGGTATVGSTIERMGPRSLVVPVDDIEHLAGVVRAATEGIGDQPGAGRFRGHITIGRAIGRRQIVGPMRPPADDARVPLELTTVALVASTLLPDGPEYRTVATFPITPDGGGGR